MTIKQITVKQLKQRLDNQESVFLLDVREPNEFDYARIEPSTLMPLNQIPQRFNELDKNKELVVLCHHGMRSMQAAFFLVQQGFSHVVNLTGGIDAWSVECDNNVPRY